MAKKLSVDWPREWCLMGSCCTDDRRGKSCCRELLVHNPQAVGIKIGLANFWSFNNCNWNKQNQCSIVYGIWSVHRWCCMAVENTLCSIVKHRDHWPRHTFYMHIIYNKRLYNKTDISYYLYSEFIKVIHQSELFIENEWLERAIPY